MTITTPEKNEERANDYNNMARESSCLMKPDVQTQVWLAAHNEVASQVGLVSTALVEAFGDDGTKVYVKIQEDPESAEEKVLFDVRTPMIGREARQVLRAFVREGLPGPAAPYRNDFIFTVSAGGAHSR